MPSESKATERCCPEKIVTSAVPSTASATRMKMASTAPSPRLARLGLRQVADVDFMVEPDFFVAARELEAHRHQAEALGQHQRVVGDLAVGDVLRLNAERIEGNGALLPRED